jgi:hypothetical protein
MVIQGVSIFIKKFILKFNMKSKIGVSSFSGGSGSGIAKACDGSGKNSGLAI